MGELMEGVNWLGVIAGTVVSFLAGWLWYSPKLFGTKWAEGSRVQLGNANEMPVGAMIAFAILAYSGSMFSQKTAYARVVDFGYWIVSLVIMVICQSLFLGMAG